MNLEFNLKTKTYIGKDSLKRIPEFLAENSFEKAGLIIDQALKSNAIIAELIDALRTEGKLAVLWYYDLPFEPDYNSLDLIKTRFKEEHSPLVDVIIAIGGGSVMDFGKGIATLTTNHEHALTYRGFPKGLNPSTPLIAVPTTAGTASEVTFNAVFTDSDSGKKLGINTHNNFPVLAILDSNMTLNCPFSVALSSGLDALVHTFESFANNKSNPYTRMFAKEAFGYLYNNIEKALTDPADDVARENMLFGAYLAGISLFNTGSGPAGALSYPLGVVCKIPHGMGGGIILPYLIKYNVEHGYTDYSTLYDEIISADQNRSDRSLTKEEKSKALCSLMFALYDRLKVWDVAAKYKIDLKSKELNEYINLLQGAFDQNPIKIGTEVGKLFLSKVFVDKDD